MPNRRDAFKHDLFALARSRIRQQVNERAWGKGHRFGRVLTGKCDIGTEKEANTCYYMDRVISRYGGLCGDSTRFRDAGLIIRVTAIYAVSTDFRSSFVRF